MYGEPGMQYMAGPVAAQQPQQRATPANLSVHSAPSPGAALPSLSRSSMIRDVWADNLDEEFAVIRGLVAEYPYVSMDTEFPGVVAKPVGNFKTTHEFYYQTLRCNVNLLKVIQLGITLLNERGEVPEVCCTWQFNFRFCLSEDTYAKDSVELLTNGGINFAYFEEYGIEVGHFAELLTSSGLILNPNVRWLAFHAGYDFGYLTRLLCNQDLPEKEEDFLQLFHSLFPCMYDLKYLLRTTELSHSLGLDALAETLRIRRFGTAHQAGSDSLLTGHCYYKLICEHFGGSIAPSQNGVLFGLVEDSASGGTPNSAASGPGMGGGNPHTYGVAQASYQSGGPFPSSPSHGVAKHQHK